MKKLLVIAFVFLFSSLAFAQTPAEGIIELRKLETQISAKEKVRAIQEIRLSELRVKYSDDFGEIRSIKESLAKSKEELAAMYFRRKELLTLGFTKNLPITQTDLLRIVIIQNERIIELLEGMQSKRN